jgi:hypothetical protein
MRPSPQTIHDLPGMKTMRESSESRVVIIGITMTIVMGGLLTNADCEQSLI